MAKWNSTPFRGVRYREHSTRKYGILKDRYFAIRYQKDCRRKEEGIGWASEGHSAESAALTLAELKQAAVKGEGHDRLAKKRAARFAKEAAEERDALSFGDIFDDRYYPQAQADKKKFTYKRELSLFKKWIKPVIGDLPLKEIAPIHMERLKKNLRDADRSPRSAQYALAVVRQVFNYATRNGLWAGQNPAKMVKIPTVNNMRTRFLTPVEAQRLLDAVRKRSEQLYEICLVSLHCGLRSAEVYDLTWSDIDLTNGILTIRDPKDTRGTGSKGRHAYMTNEIKAIFASKEPGGASQLVFTTRTGGGRLRGQVSKVFYEVVEKQGFNEGVDDRRDRVCFHTLRHTFASWLVQGGTTLYEVKERLGHSTLAITERYAHLAPDSGKATVGVLENMMKGAEKKDGDENDTQQSV